MSNTVSVLRTNKWYGLQIGSHEIPFPDEADYELYGSPYVDHCPSPLHVMKYCLDHYLFLDKLSLELITGRWLIEEHPLDTSIYDELISELYEKELLYET